MPIGRRLALCIMLGSAVVAAACNGRVLKPQYEYEEELYLGLDGSATFNLNASIPALVALRGVDLPTDPRARLDREKLRALFAHPGSDVSLSLSRRDGRRFVHVSLDVGDVRELASIAPLAWSHYRFDRGDDRIEYRQVVGAPARKTVSHVGWDGSELIAFRLHIPSEILYQNSGGQTLRGNILEWEQPLVDREAGKPLELYVQMAPESILYSTLLLFGSTIAAAALTFVAVIWWVSRRGRHADIAESRT